MSFQQFVEKRLWELHKSPRDHIDYLLGSPRDYSIFDRMVEEGTLVQNFRLRGFSNNSMERPTVPVTSPWGPHMPSDDDSMTVWVRNYHPKPDEDVELRRTNGMVYGERPIDNTPRPRGLRNPPHDFPEEKGRSYRELKEEAEQDIQRYKREAGQNLFREPERDQLTSPRRYGRQENRRSQQSYDPDASLYQPSFLATQGQNGLDLQTGRGGAGTPRRDVQGIPVMDFIKHEEFGGRGSGLDYNSNPGGTISPRRDVQGIPVTDFIKSDDYGGRNSPGQNGRDLQFSPRGAGSPRREAQGIPVTEFLKPEEFGASPRVDRHPDRRLGFPASPLYDPFGRAGGGAPMVGHDGKKKTKVFGNFEKTKDSREKEQDFHAKNVLRHDLARGMEEQRYKQNQDREYQRKSGTDLAEWMRRKEVGRPKVDPNTGILTGQHLPISDVSKMKMNYQPRDGRQTEEYRRFLQQQMEDRERNREQDRQRQQHEANEHFARFDSQWGHWGGGAPKDHKERRKLNLDNALHRSSAEAQRVSPSYQKVYYEEDLRQKSPDATPRYVKNTIRSTSRNSYDFPQDRSSRYPYQTRAPYATGYRHGY